jgi:hypothetical protein
VPGSVGRVPNSRRPRVELLADVALFAPLGLVASIAEAVPDLAMKGRARLLPKVSLARTVGQFAVGEGYRRLAALTGRSRPSMGDVVGAAFGLFRGPSSEASRRPPRRQSDTPHAGRGGQVGEGASEDGHRPPARDGGHGPGSRPAGARPGGGAVRAAGVPAASELAIPSYDSLSAPQVVRLLAGLSREEIEAVRRYEAATRGRRTILARAEQLLA